MNDYKNCIKTLGTWLLTAIFFAAVIILQLANLENETTAKSATITENLSLSVKSRKMVYEPLIIAPYKDMEVFISEEKYSDFPFTSVGGTWDEYKPKGTKVELEMRFKVNEKWTDWLELEEEEDAFNTSPEPNYEKKYAMGSTNSASAMQYKVLLYSDGVSSPLVKNFNWTFIKAGNPLNLESKPKPQYAAASAILGGPVSLATGNAPKIITRSQWGANESYRFMADNNSEPDLAEFDPAYIEKFKDELTYSKVITADSSGNKYKWPLQYPQKVKKFIIHHTATSGNLENPAQAIRDIYHYHALTRAWGDIGYNYIIDQKGNIYEGRYGGEGVIGAHSGPGNNGSIGIAVLGNYENDKLPQAVVDSIVSLVSAKSKIHGIDPDGYSGFRGEIMANIFGHRDIMPTSCPGKNLYEKIPIFGKLASQIVDERPKFVKDYDYLDHSGLFYLDMKPKETRKIQLKLENIGKVDWNKDTFIVVDKNPKFAGVISFPDSGEVVLAKMNETTVKPGAFATFDFSIKSSIQSDVVTMNIAPVINGNKKSDNYIILPVAVQQGDYKYEFIDFRNPPVTMKKGETFTAWVKLKNTGNITWSSTGENQIILKTDQKKDRVSNMVSPPSNILATLKENKVAPGSIGTFEIKLKAPQKAGNYIEHFTPYIPAEGLWLKDSGMYFSTVVLQDGYAAKTVAINNSAYFKQGNSYGVEINIKNLGSKSWKASDIKLNFTKSKQLKISKIRVTNLTGPGEIMKLEFTVTPDKNFKPGKKSILVSASVMGQKLLNRPVPVIFQIIENNTITPTKPTPDVPQNPPTPDAPPTNGEPNIRIKLSKVDFNPIITSNGDFDVFQDGKYIKTVKSGDTYAPTYISNEKAIRVIPKNGGILEIANFNNPPGWNPALNDNKYRGTLEIFTEDNKIAVVNELPIESYLRGLGEVSNSEEPEKIKAIMIAARTYAYFYLTNEKFPGKPYNLNDDPNVSQKYIGYGMEERSPKVTAGVQATRGEVVTYNGKVVKTPYFNQSDGIATKSAKDVWGWTDTPYLVSVKDSYCIGTGVFLGHGVGLSGCGAKGLAQTGKTYRQILQHYYSGVDIVKKY